MIPFYPFFPSLAPELSRALAHLERESDLAFRLLGLMADRLETALGPTALGPELGQLRVAWDPAVLQEITGRIDAVLDAKDEAAAVRLVRELTPATYDEAFDLLRAWPRMDRSQKARWARSVLLRRLAEGAAPGAGG